jgi:acetoin utilization deacetylase AcuC-like enzyme
MLDNGNNNDDNDNDESNDEPCTAAFCAVRPPGHHVGRVGLTHGVESQGYCVLNNVAIGAQYALLKFDYERVAIVDFDVHHGNGTEEIFRGHSGVLFASVHVYAPEIEFYPCTGPPEGVAPLPRSAPVVAPPARVDGNVLNVPIHVGVTGAQFRAVFDDVVVPALHAFRPDLVLISAGFDGHRGTCLVVLYQNFNICVYSSFTHSFTHTLTHSLILCR